MRHTTLTWVERNFGYAVAHAYAGHNDRVGDAGTTTTSVRADLDEIAATLAALTGEPHAAPLLPANDERHPAPVASVRREGLPSPIPESKGAS